jgi:serine/threonine protein kinase
MYCLPKTIGGGVYSKTKKKKKSYRGFTFYLQYRIISSHLLITKKSNLHFFSDRPGRRGPPLIWAQRQKIAVDVARGLNYLHFDRAMPHGNIKATNILLDGLDLNARVADYCLHRLMTQSGTIEQILDSGVLGYRAPELAASKKPTPSFKSDVYAFGVVLLELLTGRCAGDLVSGEEGGVDLTDWVRLRVAEGHGSDCFDPVMAEEVGNNNKGMKEMLGIALRCIRPVSERPGIKSVYEDLSSI